MTIGVLRRYLLIAGLVYLVWWFAVEVLLPTSFNPLGSRLAVVAATLGIWALSFVSQFIQRHLRFLFFASVWLITAHFFYLFSMNSADVDWVVGSYITVIAIAFCFDSAFSLTVYSVFVFLVSTFMVYELPALTNSVFLPGIFTILAQANIGLRARLRMIKTLGDSNRRFQDLFHSTFEGVMVHENGVIVAANEALARMSGYRHEEMIGMKIFDILAQEDWAHAGLSMQKADVTPFEACGVRKDGLRVEVEVRAKIFEYEGRPARLVTVQDITDRKRAERDKIATAAMAENIRVRDEFISIASHELRTPLSSMGLQTQMLQRDLERSGGKAFSTERLQKTAHLYARQIGRLTELVEAMLDVSRISAGKLTLKPQNFDLCKIVRDILESPQSSGVSITAELTDGLMIHADPHRMEQVIENLLTNAVKYGDGKPINIEVRGEDGQAVLTVADQGPGIATEHQARIFERFERVVPGGSISGLGLGLYITRQIIDAHGGQITVESRLGEGSVFTVKVPQGGLPGPIAGAN